MAITRLPLAVSSNFRQHKKRRPIFVKGPRPTTSYTMRRRRNCTISVFSSNRISREPWFMCEAHDVKCFDETLDNFAEAVDITFKKSPADIAVRTA